MINTSDSVASLINLETEWIAPKDCFICGKFAPVTGGGNGIVIDGIRCINFGTGVDGVSTMAYPVVPFFVKANTIISKATTYGSFELFAYGCK